MRRPGGEERASTRPLLSFSFQHICLSYELILSDGSVIECSKTENSDLFYAVPWSYGTLGFLASVKLKIIPSKRFVKLNYIPAQSLDEAAQVIY